MLRTPSSKPKSERVLRAKSHPIGLAELENRRWQNPKHVRLINRALREVKEGHLDRVLIEMPPRHGKSETSTHYGTTWYMGHNPDHDVMLGSHTKSLAAFFGGQCRDTMTALGPDVFGLQVSQANSARDEWAIQGPYGTRGKLMALGVGGSPIGRGAHLLIIDDPYGSQEDAMSEVVRESVWQWWAGTLRNRLEPNAKVIIIMQRWHEDDIIGRLKRADGITTEGGRWHLISMPAIAEDYEFWPGTKKVFREPGEALWPERYPLSALEEIKRDLEEWEGPYFWAAQYQQRPAPLGGGLIKDEWFQFFDVDEPNGFYVLERNDGEVFRYRISECRKFVTVDPAFSEKRAADWTVIGTWAVTPNDDLLKLDMIREHIEGASIADRLNGVYTREGMRYHGGRIYVEAVGGGLVVAQQGRQLGLPVQDFQVENDKYVRAMALQARMSHAKVYFPRRARDTWFRTLRDEFLLFPNGRHDDIVDESSMAAKVLAEQGTGRARSIKRALR
ncbi:MAG: terminase family protein [Rubrobacteraceae bacterium]